MTPSSDLQERIRRYLLGNLPVAEQEEIEKDLMTNGDRFEELLVIEEELIDDYLSGTRLMNDFATYEIFWHWLWTALHHGVELSDDELSCHPNFLS